MTCEMLNGELLPHLRSVSRRLSSNMKYFIRIIVVMVYTSSASCEFGTTDIPLRIEGTFEWEKQINLTCVATSNVNIVPSLKWAVNFEEVRKLIVVVLKIQKVNPCLPIRSLEDRGETNRLQ